MNRHKILFPLSFAVYIAAVYASPYVTARTWADVIAVLSVLAFAYQTAYVIRFRKTLNISLGRAIADFFLWLAALIEVLVLYTYVDAFINGYVYTFITNGYGPYYGLEAWSMMVYESLIYLPLLFLALVYHLVYFLKLHKTKSAAF